MNSSISKIAIKYLKSSNYRIDDKTFELQLETHPEYPSVKSISDTFDYFGIDNLTAKVPKEALSQLPKSFIALFKREKYFEFVLTEKKENQVIITTEELNKQKLSIQQFTEGWDGTIIAIEYNEAMKGQSIKFNLKNVSLILFCIIFLINLFFYSSTGVILYCILSVLGFLISCFIVRESLGVHNKSVAKVCEIVSKGNNCSDVINDKKSKLFNVIPLSDASILYFLINILSFIFIGFNITIFSYISYCSIPIVLFALYYQGFALKKWCALCLGVSAVLVLQFFVLLLMFDNFIFDLKFLLKYVAIAFFAFYIFSTLKDLWIKKSKLKLLEIDFMKFKRNQELFDTMLKKQKLINNNLISQELKISFGSENPIITIDAVTNPFCGYCSESFKVYYDLLKTNKDIQINFVFSVPNDIASKEMQIAVGILNIYFSGDKGKALQAMKDWYSEREIEKWKTEYNLASSIDNETFLILKNQHDWLQVNDIIQTPTTIIDGFYFPKLYNIEDLLMFVDEIILNKQKQF